MKEIVHTVPIGCNDIRISEYLRLNLSLSATLIKRAKFGGVRKNGEIVTMRARVFSGDVITVDISDEKSSDILPIDIPVHAVYEDEYIAVFDKPTNMPTHPSRGNSLPTLANALAFRYGDGFVFRAITRLDRDTSGLVLIAKDKLSAARLSSDMKLFGIEKTYEAHVLGVPSPECGIISAPIAREAQDSIRRTVSPLGKESVTEYRLLSVLSDGTSVCEISPKTGRTHQIRVHMAHIGHPLIGDFLYGERIEGKTYELCCKRLRFRHPITGETVTLVSERDILKENSNN